MVELIVNQWLTNGNIEHSRKLVKLIGQKLNLYFVALNGGVEALIT